MPPSEKPDYTVGSDGLLARNSGSWARTKHHYLRRYCDITTRAVAKKFPGGIVYLDAMSGPGRCIEEKTGEEFPGSPFVALDYDFSAYWFIEEHPELFKALTARVANHPKRALITLKNQSWTDLATSGGFPFGADTLVIAFVDPTGISQMPWTAVKALLNLPRIDVLATIQHRLGIVWNAKQYKRAASTDTALDRFLDSGSWREWQDRDATEFGQMAIDAFISKVGQEGFKTSRQIPVGEDQALYRLALFSRHPLADKFWNETVKVDEEGQRDFGF
jgi:three-Cys-motif partner protein